MRFQGKKNIYLCTECGRGHVSQDMDAGVTPFCVDCLHCGGLAQSMMYRAPQEMLARVPAAVEWYQPTPEELLTLDPGTQAHVRQGGLIFRVVERPKGK